MASNTPTFGAFYFMENLKLYIPKSHLDELREALPSFEGMLTSTTDIPIPEGIDEPYVMAEMLIPDYSILYFMGHAVGSSTMSKELQPILDNSLAKLLSLKSKIMQLEYYRVLFENYKKEENE